MAKNNIRSIRFTNELAELIECQIGRTFTEKFENLITRCVWELPQKEAELKQIQTRIDQERQRLRMLEEKRQALQHILYELNRTLNQCLDSAGETILQLEKL